jgi:hypothetical protein
LTWFRRLTGTDEGDAAAVRALFAVDGPWLVSGANGRRMRAGVLETPTLAELRAVRPRAAGPVRVSQTLADVRDLHLDPANAGATFQVASQFNLLEMVGPQVTPEAGITGYASDPTQGPACAIACGAGTIWRAYFARVPGAAGVGQSREVQFDMLADLGAALGNRDGQLWQMRNGYVLPHRGGLDAVAARIAASDREALKGLLRVGVMRDTEVTLPGGGGLVSQVYCSALPIAYADRPALEWEPFARLVLEAAYEATLRAVDPGRPVFLTLLGGGAFGNPVAWCLDAIGQAVAAVGDAGLDLRIVRRGAPSPAVTGWLEERRLAG